mmetsp:Transcript_23331/g.47251  ORF Transcript_23331/g.47251 Transcript_23331/m.47251 type:complete len:252 (+) Transcript_23331:496-1251(+)
MGDEIDLQVAILLSNLKPLFQGCTHCVDALVLRAGDLDLRPQAQRLLHQPPPQVHVDVRLDLLRQVRDVLARLGEVDLLPDVDLAVDVLLQRVVGVLVLLVMVERPRHLVAQLLYLDLVHGCYVAHDAMDSLRLGEALLLGGGVLRVHAPLRQVDVALVLVYAQDHADLCPPHAEQLRDGPDSSLGQLAKEHHALLAVVLKEADVSAHAHDPLHLHNDDVLQFGELGFIKPALGEARHRANQNEEGRSLAG